jgi:hypothetical protein
MGSGRPAQCVAGCAHHLLCQLDLIGPLRLSDGNKYTAVFIDLLTKHCWLRAIPDKEGTDRYSQWSLTPIG